MKWIKTTDELPPIGEYVMTCRYASDDLDEVDPYQVVEIMTLHRKTKKQAEKNG